MNLRRQTTDERYSRIGDAFHFITNILHLSSQLSERCRILIENQIEKFKMEFQQREPVATKTSDLTVEQKLEKNNEEKNHRLFLEIRFYLDDNEQKIVNKNF